MSQALTVSLDKPIVATKLLDGCPQSEDSPSSAHAPADSGTQAGCAATGGSDAQRTAFSQACQTLNGIIATLNDSYAKIFTEHGEEIARLSVEIARKVLMQKVEKGDYEIESIVKEAIMHAPSRHDLVVHLNPDDLAQCQKAQQHDEQGGALAGIKLVPDPNIGRAECLLDTPKGIIKSLMDENLERIGRALRKEE
ncbi:MAG: FliH/SctL family protein [Planctomycetota bacterium]|jgi:flagellar biosynthesis/type III secretory pathway protein FliH